MGAKQSRGRPQTSSVSTALWSRPQARNPCLIRGNCMKKSPTQSREWESRGTKSLWWVQGAKPLAEVYLMKEKPYILVVDDDREIVGAIAIVLTRETEDGLYDAHASNKKVQDMKRRIEIIEKTDPVLTVSIHQNSYPEEYVHGAQVFYYTGSMGSETLASGIQDQLVRGLDPENHRKVKANDSYYLLKKTKGTIVIVECGFLSNQAEAEKLCDEEYQDRIAWLIHKGILRYLKQYLSILSYL